MDPKRTFHASQAVHMSDLLNLRFAKDRFGTERPRYLRVREPDGPSTAGGRTARQAITLIDFRDDSRSSTLVCGFIDTVAKKAELRNFAVVKQAYEQRFGRPIDISRGEYNRMLSVLQDFFAGQGIETQVLNAPPAAPCPPSNRTSNRTDGPTSSALATAATPAPAWAWVSVGFILGFAVCYAMLRNAVL